jgi:tRNA-2-methylthio-N6-dimethylallyladenosine synthase
MFKYSERPGTAAAKRFADDIPEDIKKRRLNEIISLQQKLSLQSNKKDVGKTFEVLIEGKSHRSDKDLYGRNSQNKVLVFPRENYDAGMYVNVKVNNCTAATLLGKVVKND